MEKFNPELTLDRAPRTQRSLDIPNQLWDEVKSAAAKEGLLVKSWIMEAFLDRLKIDNENKMCWGRWYLSNDMVYLNNYGRYKILLSKVKTESDIIEQVLNVVNEEDITKEDIRNLITALRNLI